MEIKVYSAVKSIRALPDPAGRRQSSGYEAARNFARQQEIIMAAGVHDAGSVGGGAPRAPKKITAHRSLDGTPGVLCHDETPHAVGSGEPLVRFEPDRNTKPDEGPVARDAPFLCQSDSLRADRADTADLAKEDIRWVLTTQGGPGLGILLHPSPDRRHRHVVAGDDSALYQETPDRHIRLPVLPVIADPEVSATAEP